jgi:heparanase 1
MLRINPRFSPPRGGICSSRAFSGDPVSPNPAKIPVLDTVDKRFQSFNIEMLEVTAGRFWKP